MYKTSISLTLILFFSLLLSCSNSTVAPSGKPEYTASELFNKVMEATSIDKLKDVKSFSCKMTLKLPPVKNSNLFELTFAENKIFNLQTEKDYGEFYSVDNKILQSQLNGNYKMGCDDINAWFKTTADGANKLEDSTKDSFSQLSLAVWKDPKAYYYQMEVGPFEIFDEKDCYVLICKNKKDGFSDRIFYIDSDTFLIKGTVEIQHKPLKTKIKRVYHSYKKSENGVLYADQFSEFRGRLDKSQQEVVDSDGLTLYKPPTHFTITEIKFNPFIDDKIFLQPEVKKPDSKQPLELPKK